MTLQERILEIEKKHKMEPEDVAAALRMPASTYRGFRVGARSVSITHWQRIALDFLLAEGPKKYAKIVGAH